MDRAKRMGHRQPLGQPAHQCADFCRSRLERSEQIGHVATVDIFGDDVVHAQLRLMREGAVLHQRRVAQPGQRARLLAEHRQHVGIAGEVRQDHLDCDPLILAVDVHALEYFAHAATGDEPAHFIEVIEDVADLDPARLGRIRSGRSRDRPGGEGGHGHRVRREFGRCLGRRWGRWGGRCRPMVARLPPDRYTAGHPRHEVRVGVVARGIVIGSAHETVPIITGKADLLTPAGIATILSQARTAKLAISTLPTTSFRECAIRSGVKLPCTGNLPKIRRSIARRDIESSKARPGRGDCDRWAD